MGYFETTRKTKRLKLPSNPEFWVEIYTSIKWGETKHFLQVKDGGDIDMVASADQFLRHLIKEWNLTDEQGKVVPIDQEHIDMLERDDALFLVKEAGAEAVQAESAKKN